MSIPPPDKNKENDLRHRRRFLWFPKTIDGDTRWLERASWIERYTAESPFHSVPLSVWTVTSPKMVWKPISWQTISYDFYDGVTLTISPHPLNETWWNVTCDNGQNFSITKGFSQYPTKGQLQEAAQYFNFRRPR